MSESTEVALPEADLPSEGDAASLVELAIREKVPVEVLERLVALQERVSDRNARAAFFEALSAAQEEFPEIGKAHKAQIRTKSGGSYSYTYAALEDITRAIRPVLRGHGLSYSWTTEPGEGPKVLNVVCILRHTHGHEERATFPVPTETDAAMSGAQKQGAALTYGRRQSLVSVLGLTTAAEDTDAPAGGDAGKPSEEKIEELNLLIEKHGADVRGLCKWVGKDSIPDFTAHDCQRAIDAIRRKYEAGEP